MAIDETMNLTAEQRPWYHETFAKWHEVMKPYAGFEPGDVIRREGDSSIFLAEFPDDYFDGLYLDGEHTYEGVRKDVEVARHKVEPGGYNVFNDYTIWSAVEFMPYGVPYVLHQLAIDHGWTMMHLALNPLFYCDVAPRPPISAASIGTPVRE